MEDLDFTRSYSACLLDFRGLSTTEDSTVAQIKSYTYFTVISCLDIQLLVHVYH